MTKDDFDRDGRDGFGCDGRDERDGIERDERDSFSAVESDFEGDLEDFDGLDDLHAELASLAAPVTPPPALKDSIMAQLDDLPQVDPQVEPEAAPETEPDSTPAPQAAAQGASEPSRQPGELGRDNVVNLGDRRKASAGHYSGRRSWMGVVSIAAALVLIAGVGVGVGWPSWFGGSDSETAVTADGVEQMHEIMAASDVRSVELVADGASLSVVVSSDMDAGGAMVNGAPELAEGMGAQVWSIDSEGNARSAGVIGQEPHSDVWMPLPGDTMAVQVTVEPMTGANAPTGAVLASVEL